MSGGGLSAGAWLVQPQEEPQPRPQLAEGPRQRQGEGQGEGLRQGPRPSQGQRQEVRQTRVSEKFLCESMAYSPPPPQPH
ncbi:hypothetical protein J4Q44_G00333290, partial [Coregonus suidteri]